MEILIDTFCHFPRIVQMLVVLFFQFFVMLQLVLTSPFSGKVQGLSVCFHPCPGFSASDP
jgi:hypothetical protein